MQIYSKYISSLLDDCKCVDFSDFEDDSNVLHQSVNTYSLNKEGAITHLSIIGKRELDLKEIFSITTISYLILVDCKISALPDSISNLIDIYMLDLSFNNIVGLPDGITKLSNLSDLRLTGNKLSSLPFDFGELNELVWCYLDDNRLEYLPDSIGKLKIIDRLDLSENKIRELPDSFGNLDSLVELDLRKNKLTTLPNSMRTMDSIDRIELDDNDLGVDLDELNSMNAIDLINFIVNSKGLNTTLLNEFKLLVVGDERVGKTSIINSLLGREYNPNCESTPGVDISNGLEFEDYKVNIWDFAGQEITHQTHQFFLSKRSLYFLVIDAQTEDDSYSIYNWLSTIRTYGGPESPIVIVVNKIDLNHGYVFDRELYEKEFNIKNVIYTSAKCNQFFTNVGLKTPIDLNSLIVQNSKYIQGLNFKMPLSWLRVKEHIESESYTQKDIIELNEFEDLCVEYNVVSFRDQSSLLSLLNQIGTVVAYVDDERLNIIQIINPTWLTNAVYKIIRSEKIKSDGVLDYHVLEQIFLSDDSYRRRHFRWLLDLLIQFDLAFEIEKKKILIPARLSNTQPNYDFKIYSRGFGYRFDYHTFLKRNILSQLIVKMNKFIDSDSPKYWKRGVFFKNKVSRAVVVLDEFRKTIDISISGDCLGSIDLRSKIVDSIRDINDDKYDVDEMVAIKDGSDVLDYESYDFLDDLVQTGYDEHVVKIRDSRTRKLKAHKIKIRELLFGFKEDNHEFDYSKLTISIIESLLLIAESRQIVFKEKENSINVRLRDLLLSRGYFAADQSLGGESENGKVEGERDIVIRSQSGVSMSIIEGLCLKSCLKKKINEHYQKLVSKYDTSGHKVNYLTIYSKSSNFESLCNKYHAHFVKLGPSNWQDKWSSESRSIKVLETSIDKGVIYHLMINLSSN
ncbi:GTP-binding protein [Vibrio europaeus]|uniref:GTP-binding protein n=1 Tax=Vibrio europaeus TaxID=300876 RepID=A0AAE7AVZ0_9VIBR|nr:COR domain-containing protein [Vibrio europaeus]QJY36935.1 GTP-binding protein [Vibrio europaeus]